MTAAILAWPHHQVSCTWQHFVGQPASKVWPGLAWAWPGPGAKQFNILPRLWLDWAGLGWTTSGHSVSLAIARLGIVQLQRPELNTIKFSGKYSILQVKVSNSL